MTTVRSAIHIRTGQRSATAEVDQWLARYGLAVRACDDAYAACVMLLREFREIPDLAFVGTDWLAVDEHQIVTYLRQTWPPVGIVVYGEARDAPVPDVLPLVTTCCGAVELAAWLRLDPAEVYERLARTLGPSPAGGGTMAAPEAPRTPVAAPTGLPTFRPARPAVDDRPAPAGLRIAPAAPPRTLLTAEELAALLGPQEQR